MPEEAGIVCLVGGNGTGKSQILELIAACAQRIGLTPGTESSRGDPFNEAAQFEVSFLIAPGAIPALDAAADFPAQLQEAYPAWDRTLLVSSDPSRGQQLVAGGIRERSVEFARRAVELIKQSAAVHYLSLDADRAYPKVQIASHQLGEVIETGARPPTSRARSE